MNEMLGLFIRNAPVALPAAKLKRGVSYGKLVVMGKEAIEKLCRRLLNERARTLRTIAQELNEGDLRRPSGTEELSVADILQLLVVGDADFYEGEEEEAPAGAFLHPLYFIRLASETRGKLLAQLQELSDEDLDSPFGDSNQTVRQVVEELISSESDYLRPALERYIDSRGGQG